MSARADLTGQQFGEWTISHKAPAQNRKPFWTVEHACGRHVDIAHTLLVPLTKGKAPTLPPCTSCTPSAALPGISHGMHLACGQSHLVGTPCGKAGPGECKHGLGWQSCGECGGAWGRPEPAPGAYVELPPYPAASLDLDDPEGESLASFGALDLDAYALEDEAPRELDLDALDAEPLPPVIELDLAAFAGGAWPERPADVDPAFVPEVHQATSPAERALVAATDAAYAERFEVPAPGGYVGWSLTNDKAPEATLNREFRDVLLAPMYEAMAGHERGSQAKPGPSGVGGCRRKLAHQLLYADEFEPRPSGWAAMKGTVLHAWYDGLCTGRPGWFSDLALPQVVQSIAGGTLDLYVDRRIVDLKAPGTSTMKEARAGRLSNGYYVQTQVYGLGAEMLGLVVEHVGLLFVPMCGDNLDEAIYWEWPYDRNVATAALADAERIVELGRTGDRAEVLASMPTRSDFCSSCPAFGRHCAGALAPMPAAPRGGLELVRP